MNIKKINNNNKKTKTTKHSYGLRKLSVKCEDEGKYQNLSPLGTIDEQNQ